MVSCSAEQIDRSFTLSKSERVALRYVFRNQEEQICEQQLSWYAVRKLVKIYRQSLLEQGVTHKSSIALIGKNSLELLISYLAILSLGGRVIPLNPQFPLGKISQLCQEFDIEFYHSIEPLNLSFTKEILLPSISSALASMHNISFNRSDSDTLMVNISEDEYSEDNYLWYDALTMTLTSGSSGNPKAVVHNIMNHLSSAEGVCKEVRFNQESSWLFSLPLFHVSGQGIVWRWLLKRAVLVINTVDFIHGINQSSHSSLVMTQLKRYVQHCDKNIVKHDKTFLLGGSYLEPEWCAKAEKLGINCYMGYGMTEFASTVTAKRYDSNPTVGHVLPGKACKIIDEQVYLQGESAGLGYWKNGGIDSFVDEQGWYRSGDRGCWKGDELSILGRCDNMFISGGENIQPEEIESILLKHPDIIQAFIIPITDDVFGQRPCAIVELNEQSTQRVTEEQQIVDITIWLNKYLERFKHPVVYYLFSREVLSQTGQIKITRRELFEFVSSNKEGGIWLKPKSESFISNSTAK